MAELDVMLGVPGVSAELDVVVGRAVKKAMATEDRVQRWRDAGSPLLRAINFSGTVSAAQAGLGTPQAFFPAEINPIIGRMWSVRKVTVYGTGAGPFAAALANVNAALYVTQQGTAVKISEGPPTIDAEQPTFSLPAVQFYSTHQFWVRGGEWPVIGVQGSGVTSGFQVWGRIRCLEIDDDPRFLLDL